MDLHEVWEKNKRWILGVVGGAVVFWVALGLVRSAFDVDGKVRGINVQKRKVAGEDLYGSAALDAAEEEQARLKAQNEALREALAFVPGDDYLLEGKGDADAHWSRISRRTRDELRERAANLNIEVATDGIRLPQPQGQVEIAEALLVTNLVREVGDRLLDAGEQVLVQEPENLGLVRIELLGVTSRRKAGARRFGPSGGNRYRSRQQRRRGARDAAQAVADAVKSVQVDLRCEADAPTVWAFLEACRALEPHITVDTFVLEPGRERGDPQTVTAKLSALIFRDA